MNSLGIYEKALPSKISWKERLLLAKQLGFDFIEISIDETDERLARLDWDKLHRKQLVMDMFETGIRIQTMCLSGHRRYPLGSHEKNKREKALKIMQKAIDLASDLGVRVIQLAGYDVYYEEKDESTKDWFISNLKKACSWAAEKQIILAIEIMDDSFMNSITKYKTIAKAVNSPWLYVYPDLGNLSAWNNDVVSELQIGINDIAAIHLKDTKAVTDNFVGQFKDVPFGEGCVDFKKCLNALKNLNYGGPFLIEMWSEKSEDPAFEIEGAKQFLIPILKEAGFTYDK